MCGHGFPPVTARLASIIGSRSKADKRAFVDDIMAVVGERGSSSDTAGYNARDSSFRNAATGAVSSERKEGLQYVYVSLFREQSMVLSMPNLFIVLYPTSCQLEAEPSH